MADVTLDEPPYKKQRVSVVGGGGEGGEMENVLQHITAEGIEPVDDRNEIGPDAREQTVVHQDELDEESKKEARAGITAYVQEAGDGFTGVLKQRYTDFLVNEVLPDGTTLHLSSIAVPLRNQPGFAPDEPENDPVEYLDEPQNKVNNNSKDETTAKRHEDDPEKFELGEGDRITLRMIFGEDVLQSIEALYKALLKSPNKKPRDFTPVQSEGITDRQVRTQAHQAIRKVFGSRLESWTEGDGIISIRPAPHANKDGIGGHGAAPRLRGKPGWAELGGEYLHFTLFKENKDTMEIVYFLASQLKVNVKNFQFGGTKDRRAVTTQRCSAYRTRAEQLHAIGKRLRQSKVGDFVYSNEGLELGELGGNEFCITLRDCHFSGEQGLDMSQKLELAKSIVGKRMERFQRQGFINYYGLQRFGSFSTSTSTVGTKLLQDNLKGAVDDILHYTDEALAAAQEAEKESQRQNENQHSSNTTTPHASSKPTISSEDRARALAIHIFRTTSDGAAALAKLPRKFSAESNLIRHLGSKKQQRSNDYQGALMTIPRTLRLMYVHAYQSLVWNTVAAQRWRRFGNVTVEGDLVLISECGNGTTDPDSSDQSQQQKDNEQRTHDEQGDPIIAPANNDRSTQAHDYERARPLTAAEAASGRYSVFDVVLPLPGYDVVYPPNEIGAFYKEFMASEQGGGLDPHDMRRKWKDASLSGGYRKLIVRAEGQGSGAGWVGGQKGAKAGEVRKDVQWELKRYTFDDEQLVETDLDILQRREGTDNKAPVSSSAAQNGKKGEAGDSVEEFVVQGSESEGEKGAGGGTASMADDEEQTSLSSLDATQNSSEAAANKIALILRLRLGPSMYATMALRELMGRGGVKTFKPDVSGGR